MKRLLIWTGPVSSAKTTEALHVAQRLVRRGNDLVLVRPRVSQRPFERDYHGFLVTKNGERWPCLDVTSVHELPAAAENASVLWIDEPFMLKDQEALYEVVRKLQRKMIVMISTISSTSEGEPISPQVSALLAVADRIEHCRADCDDCGRDNNATRSWYVAGIKEERIKTGGEESYEPKCPRCWTKRFKERKAALTQT